MPAAKEMKFTAVIEIIGVNPYVLLPENILLKIFDQAGKSRGPIPVKGTINGNDYLQTLVKYAGHWRLYLNMPMRKSAGIDVGDKGIFTILFDPVPREFPMHPKLKTALNKNHVAFNNFNKLSAYRQKEIVRYIHHLKSEQAVEKNILKVVNHLTGNGRFAGRDPEDL